MKRVFLLLIVMVFFSEAGKSQVIELENIVVSCTKISNSDTIIYKPFELLFCFVGINTSSEELYFGGRNFYFDIEPEIGYFEVRIEGYEPYKLRGDNLKLVTPNYELPAFADTYELFSSEENRPDNHRSYNDNFDSFEELYEYILQGKLKLYYLHVGEDSKFENKPLFPSQEVEMNGFFMTNGDDVETIESYYITKKEIPGPIYKFDSIKAISQ